MIGLYILFGGMILFATFAGVVDLLAERRHRKARHRGD